MAASNTDKITDVRNAARPNSARVTSGRSAAGATLACDNLSGWPTVSKVHFVTYRVDSNSAVVAGTQLDCYGIVSGNNIGSMVVVDGSDTGNSVGDYVEMLPTAAWAQDLADALTIGHTRSGAHISGLPLTSPILTTPVITDYTGAGHTHASTAQGGLIPSSGLNLTTSSNYLTSADVTMTTAGTYYDGASLTLVAGTYILIGSLNLGNGAAVTDFTGKIWDGTNAALASGACSNRATTASTNLTMLCLATPSGTTTYKASAQGNNNNSAIFKAASGANTSSYLIAIRIG